MLNYYLYLTLNILDGRHGILEMESPFRLNHAAHFLVSKESKVKPYKSFSLSSPGGWDEPKGRVGGDGSAEPKIPDHGP